MIALGTDLLHENQCKMSTSLSKPLKSNGMENYLYPLNNNDNSRKNNTRNIKKAKENGLNLCGMQNAFVQANHEKKKDSDFIPETEKF